MFVKPMARLGDLYENEYGEFFNRTGATLEPGQVAMLDLLGTQTETTNNIPGDSASGFANLTPVTQAGANAGFPIVVADVQIADGAKGRCLVAGIREVAVLDDDVSTTNVDIGDAIGILVSESAVAVQASATDDLRVLGIALEDAAATSADADRLIDASSHRRRCLWTGGIPCVGKTILDS